MAGSRRVKVITKTRMCREVVKCDGRIGVVEDKNGKLNRLVVSYRI